MIASDKATIQLPIEERLPFVIAAVRKSNPTRYSKKRVAKLPCHLHGSSAHNTTDLV